MRIHYRDYVDFDFDLESYQDSNKSSKVSKRMLNVLRAIPNLPNDYMNVLRPITMAVMCHPNKRREKRLNENNKQIHF